MSLRKSLSEVSDPRPDPKFQTLFAHFSNSVSCVTPRSSVTSSYFVRPGDLLVVLGLPPSRCSTSSVERLRADTLLTPATYRPSHRTRNLKFLYGSKRFGFTLNCATAASSRLDLAGDLLDPQNDELGGLQRREPDEDVHDAAVDVVLGGRLAVALDEVRLARAGALERALAEERLHERTDVEPDLRPQRLVVPLEDDPLRAAVEALLDEEREPPDRHVLPLRGELVGADERPCAPDDGAEDGERPQAVEAERVERAVLRVGERDREALRAADDGVGAGGRLPDAALGVRPCVDAGDRAARGELALAEVLQRVGSDETREVCGRVLVPQARVRRQPGARLVDRVGRGGQIDDRERAPLLAVRDRLRQQSRVGDAGDAEDVEDVDALERVEARLRETAATEVHGRRRRSVGARDRRRLRLARGADAERVARDVLDRTAAARDPEGVGHGSV